jgi:NADH-quinone oxidoreductase subunit L
MLIVIFPILGLLVSLFGRYLGKKAASWLPIVSVGASFVYSAMLAIEILSYGKTYSYTISWINLENLHLNFTFLVDPLSVSMSMLITFITFLVMVYSYAYLENDPSLVRFLSFFALFDVCMLLMVTSGNYVQFFVGWEGVGLTSYLLISFWVSRNEANKGALKAVTVNRVGDIFFMLALAVMWLNFKSFDFATVFSLFPEILTQHTSTIGPFEMSSGNLLAFLILIAACAKSAQFLLHLWLPDAMEGPTPVSSLLHSATMVTAGIYLIIRSSHIFALTPAISVLMTILGVITAVTSGLMGLMQFDLKRIIAYSTCSQLGFMTMACGLGYYSYAFFHLTTHAFFKCLLFLCSGSIIHALNDEQDIRKMGNLFWFLPITFSCMLIGTLALTGFPFLAGYYSKDLILETAYVSSDIGIAVFFLGSAAAFLTSFYSMRSLYLVFFRNNSPVLKLQIPNIHEAPALMLIPMIILSILSVFSGYLLQSPFTGPTNIWGSSITHPANSTLLDHEYIPLYIKLIPTILGLAGLIMGYLIFRSGIVYVSTLRLYLVSNLAHQKFYIDQLYNYIVAKSTMNTGYTQYTKIDRGFLEILGPYGLTKLALYLKILAKLHTGFLSQYVFILLLCVLLGFVLYTFLSASALLLVLLICYFFL